MLLHQARTLGPRVGMSAPEAQRVPTPCRAPSAPYLMCPPGPGGQGLGKRRQSLYLHSWAWSGPRGPLQLLGIRSSSHPVPLLPPPPPDKRRNGRKIQYLPPPAQAWPLQRKRRTVTQENPQCGPTTHQLPWWQGDYEQRGTCRRTGSLSPAKGTSRRQRVTPCSRKVFIFLRRIPTDGLTAAGVIQRVRPPTHQCPSFFPPPPKWTTPGKTALVERQLLSIFIAVSISVASKYYSEAKPCVALALFNFNNLRNRTSICCPPRGYLATSLCSCRSASVSRLMVACCQHTGSAL